MTIGNNDVFFGLRLALNDEQDTAALAGAAIDRQSEATILFMKAERRLSDTWKAEFEARVIANVPTGRPLAGIRSDDFVTLRLLRYF